MITEEKTHDNQAKLRQEGMQPIIAFQAVVTNEVVTVRMVRSSVYHTYTHRA